MGLGSILLGFLAGMLSTLSPCVLPLLPLVVGTALSAHRWGALLLAAGLALSFTVTGLFLATIGFALDLDSTIFRTASATLLALAGLTLLSAPLQSRFALATGAIGQGANHLIDRYAPTGPAGQFITGLLLGAVWTPCAGPTLGAASLLAAQTAELPTVAAIMLAVGLGAALPLLLVGTLSRQALRRLAQAGTSGKPLFGALALLTALLILTGTDHRFETWAVNASPDWLTNLTTRY